MKSLFVFLFIEDYTYVEIEDLDFLNFLNNNGHRDIIWQFQSTYSSTTNYITLYRSVTISPLSENNSAQSVPHCK